MKQFTVQLMKDKLQVVCNKNVISFAARFCILSTRVVKLMMMFFLQVFFSNCMVFFYLQVFFSISTGFFLFACVCFSCSA